MITALDFETTGSVRGYPVEPWQLGMVRMRGGRVGGGPGDAWEHLLRIDPGRPFNPRAPGRHALLRAELAAAPTLPECWEEAAPWLTEGPLAAHNIGTERTMLRRAAPLHRFGPWIDTLALVRHAYPGLPSKALDDVAEALGLTGRIRALCPGRAPHDALYDAFACGVVLEHLLALPGWGDLPVDALAAADK